MSTEDGMPKPRVLTRGQKLVRVSFNPSQNPLVDETKQAFADIADKMYEEQDLASGSLQQPHTYTTEAAREFAMAITDIQKTCMMAVAALTNKHY